MMCPNPATEVPPSDPSSVSKTSNPAITVAELEKHSTAKDFWLSIDGQVYDLSTFKHPGGVLINACAGTEASVMFHQYHFSSLAIQDKILSKRRVGVLTGKVAPQMGPFYKTLSARVAAVLKSETRRPRFAALMLFADVLAALFFTAWALWWLTSDSSSVLVFLVPHLVEIFTLRCMGHNHAVGHMHVFGARTVEYAELFMLVFGFGVMPVYGLPGPDRNMRSLTNRARSISQREYPFGNLGRGPYEHQAIHHVKGSNFEDDACKGIAGAQGRFRLAPEDPFAARNARQANFLYRLVVTTIAGPLILLKQVELHYKYSLTMLSYGYAARALASALGIAVQCASMYASFVVPARHSVPAFLAVLFVRYFTCPRLMFFFAQHKWDEGVPESKSDEDWGAANVRACYSLDGRGVSRFMPLLWGMGGAMPATHSFHLEHTLFPGVCYLHLPKIAAVVETTCREFGLPYQRIGGIRGLNAEYTRTLKKYSVKNSAD